MSLVTTAKERLYSSVGARLINHLMIVVSEMLVFTICLV